MRSYEAARSLHSMMEMAAWGMIISGGFIALGLTAAAAQMTSFGRGPSEVALFMAAMPGIGIAGFGFLSLAQVQNARAAVDCAELSQQMLKVARDTLEVSQQALRQGQRQPQSFSETASNDAGASSSGTVSFADAIAAAPAAASAAAEAIPAPSEVSAVASETADNASVEVIDYAGRKIRIIDGRVQVANSIFADLESAKRYLDQLPQPRPTPSSLLAKARQS